MYLGINFLLCFFNEFKAIAKYADNTQCIFILSVLLTDDILKPVF